MDYLEKAALSQTKKKRNIISISAVGAICAVGLLLAAYSIMIKDYMYAFLYIIAVIVGMAYVIIKINSVIPSYIAAGRDFVVMQCWDNGAFPYRIDFKPAFFADFVPARVVREEIPVSQIESILVGSKNYLVRNLEDTDFPERINAICNARKTEDGAVRRMDFVCIKNTSGKVFFMPITDMEPTELARVINLIHRKKEEADIKCNLRDIRSRLTV